MKIFAKVLNTFSLHSLIILLIFVALFSVQRFALLFLNLDYFSDTPVLTLIQSFFVALRFDLRSSLYLLSFYFLVANIFYLFNLEKAGRIFAKIYLSLCAYIFILLGIIELYFFDYFHIRLNSYTLNTFENPAFVFQMLWESYPIVPLLLFSFLIMYLLYRLFGKLSEMYLQNYSSTKISHKILAFVSIILLSIIGLRGTFEIKTPLRWGHAFFSEYTKANQLALNYVFTFVDDVSHKSDKSSYKKYLTINKLEEAKQNAQNLIIDSASSVLNFPLREYNYQNGNNKRKYNVVVFLLESFSQTKINKHTEKGYNLFINELAKKSLSFNNCYSNGFHTYMGLFSTMSGMPNIHADNVMKRTEGRQRFSSLPNILKSNGYKTYFAVSHVPNFDNMGGFMSMNGTDKIISENDFDKSEVLSSLGVPDHRLFEEMNNTFRSSNTPFFATILSSNNHGPWIIPEVKGKSFDNTFLYTDWALEHFFYLASKEEYFDNTIFVITADHGIPEDAIYDFDLSATHVPMIFYSPKHIASSQRNNIMSHIDLTETVLGIIELPHKTSSFSRNILSLPESENGFALVQEGMKIGLIYNNWYIIDRLGSNPSLYKYKSKTPTYDYSKDSTHIVKDLRHKLHSLYFLSNEMIFEMQASVSNY